MSQYEVWLGVLNRLRDQVPALDLQTWLAPLEMGLLEDRVVLKAPNRFFAEWIGEHYRPALDQALAEAVGKALPLKLKVESSGGAAGGSATGSDAHGAGGGAYAGWGPLTRG